MASLLIACAVAALLGGLFGGLLVWMLAVAPVMASVERHLALSRRANTMMCDVVYQLLKEDQ